VNAAVHNALVIWNLGAALCWVHAATSPEFKKVIGDDTPAPAQVVLLVFLLGLATLAWPIYVLGELQCHVRRGIHKIRCAWHRHCCIHCRAARARATEGNISP